MKYFKYVFCLILLVLLYPSNCLASSKTYNRTKDNLLVPNDVTITSENVDIIMRTPAVDSTEKVYDFAEILSDEEENEIYKSIKEYYKNSGFEAIVVTTKNLNGFTIADYVYNFYDYNSFDNEGVVFLIYLSNGNPEIFMGNSGDHSSEIFSIYSDKRINAILKYVYNNYIKEGKYYDACIGYVKILSGFYEKAHGDYDVDDEGNVVKVIPWVEIIIISLALTFIVVLLSIGKIFKKKIVINEFIKKSVNNDTMVVKLESEQSINKK